MYIFIHAYKCVYIHIHTYACARMYFVFARTQTQYLHPHADVNSYTCIYITCIGACMSLQSTSPARQ